MSNIKILVSRKGLLFYYNMIGGEREGKRKEGREGMRRGRKREKQIVVILKVKHVLACNLSTLRGLGRKILSLRPVLVTQDLF